MKIIKWGLVALSTVVFNGSTSPAADKLDLTSLRKIQTEMNENCAEMYEYKFYTKKISKHKYKKRLRKTNPHKHSHFTGIFHAYKNVNTNISSKLEEALSTCNFDTQLLITSALRPHCKKSLHSKGLAVDISWDENTLLFKEWLETESGKDWLNSNNLDYYLENITIFKGHDKYFYNRHATGPHIHLFVMKK